MTQQLKVRRDGAVMEIIFARPEKKNALSNAMYRTAAETLNEAQANPAVRVVLFGAEGNAFTAGNDLADFASASAGKPDELQAHRFIEALARADKPIVAAVSGLAVGVGTTMLLHCDLVYVAATAQLTTPFVNLALVPEAASSMLLPARIGHVRGFAMFAFGEALSGHEAVALGLANKALPAEQVLPAAREAARMLANRPLGSLIATKKLMRDRERVRDQIDRERAIFAERLRTAEAAEAFRAFAERRQPDFSKVAQ
jgi:enoyl-CoA hydratase/carnithine racemase